MQSKGLITTPIPTKTKKRNEITNKRERAIIDALARIDRSKEIFYLLSIIL
ncbi:11618_t:CDS:2 [Gigaspora margarita]|uniref:11618_t:CDS:1 n=1 Tax=Gigaspora margarita TaxID=4874 RepID=A0ABN7URF5_GIGMA|nr:11618_t:CDS:2 [Gigaspora margarita]